MSCQRCLPITVLMQYSFAVTKDTTTCRAKAELPSYFGVAVGLGVVLALIVIFGVIVVVVSVLWLKRHQWILPCTGDLDLKCELSVILSLSLSQTNKQTLA